MRVSEQYFKCRFEILTLIGTGEGIGKVRSDR
jgi:hypothetical protein